MRSSSLRHGAAHRARLAEQRAEAKRIARSRQAADEYSLVMDYRVWLARQWDELRSPAARRRTPARLVDYAPVRIGELEAARDWREKQPAYYRQKIDPAQVAAWCAETAGQEFKGLPGAPVGG